ncbi:MAG TPA: YkgJ family cysteine cluster protein [Desulfatiglandales bacterium]|nr:YkgJ family cysteine cluster protein [Desulfatiglandales bacterium]
MGKHRRAISGLDGPGGKKSGCKAIELACHWLGQMDDAIERIVSLERLPEPIDCQPGCHYCCYNQPILTPLEALLIGRSVEETFTDRARSELFERMAGILELTRDKSRDEIMMMRHDLPCIFLKDGMCSIYEVRPAICRACSSTSAEHCATVFESRDARARLRCYAQIREIFQTVHSGLIENCEDMGCQSDLLLIAEAMHDYFQHSRPMEAWLDGNKVFHPR